MKGYKMNYFVTAIGTDSGKTLVSAILTEMLHADYWKPVQAGDPRDTDTVQALVSNPDSRFFPEAYRLKMPASPHAAAKNEGIHINIGSFDLPVTDRDLVIEGAGGILVPINDNETILDLVPRFQAEIILVANLYLGSINHTLLTCEIIRHRGYPIRGIIFNGESNHESERIILLKSGLKKLLHIAWEKEIDRKKVLHYAQLLSSNWK